MKSHAKQRLFSFFAVTHRQERELKTLRSIDSTSWGIPCLGQNLMVSSHSQVEGITSYTYALFILMPFSTQQVDFELSIGNMESGEDGTNSWKFKNIFSTLKSKEQTGKYVGQGQKVLVSLKSRHVTELQSRIVSDQASE